jgi:hypothetical protein
MLIDIKLGSCIVFRARLRRGSEEKVSFSVKESVESASTTEDIARGRLIKRPQALYNGCTILNTQIELILKKKRKKWLEIRFFLRV